MHRKTSEIWQYCTVLDRTHAKCTICKQKLSYKSSITNIKRHLARKHPEVCQYVAGSNQYHVETIEIKPGTSDSDGAICAYDENESAENEYNLDGPGEILTTTCGTFRFHIVPKPIAEANMDESTEKNAEMPQNLPERESRKQKTSDVWQHCTPINKEYAKCNTCEAVLSYRTSITNIKKHLVRKHNFDYPSCQSSKIIHKNSYIAYANDDDEPSTSDVQMDISPAKTEAIYDENNPSFLHTYSRKRDSQSLSAKARMDNKFLDIFVKDYQPLRIVDDIGFRSFVKSLNSSYVLPSKQQILKTLSLAYGKCLSDMKEHAQSIKECCLTTESWTSEFNDSFLSITVHFIDEEFTMKSILLECVQICATTDVTKELQRIAEEWDITQKILLVVSDNDTNVQNAASELQWNHFGCFAHTINFVVQDALTSIDFLLEKIKSVVIYFKMNSEANSKLLICQKNTENNPGLKKLIQDDGRWISELRMLERFLELEESIKQTSLLYQDTNLSQLNEEDWTMARELCQVLKPFETVANFISSDKYTNASLVIVLTKELDDALEEMRLNNYSQPINEIVLRLKSSLQDQLGNVETAETLALCTYLDPRFKNLGFSSSEVADATKLHLVELLSNKITDQTINIDANEIKHEPSSSFSIWQSFKKRVSECKQPGTSKSKAVIEVERYLEDELTDQQKNPLEWWKESKGIYPCMSVIAQEIMCVLGTAAPSDRTFSKSGFALNLRRSCLNSDEVKVLMFLNNNYALLGKNKFDV